MTKGLVKREPTDVGSLLFDLRPIEVGRFALTGRSARPVGKPGKKDWIAAMQYSVGCEESSPYWIWDLMAYFDGRADWQEFKDQMIHLTGYASQTLLNKGYLGRHVAEPERILAPTPGHAAAVAALPQQEQTILLSTARTDGLTVAQLNREIRARKRRKVIEGQAKLEGVYRVIYADPPWPYNDRQASGSGSDDHFPAMKIEDIIALPIAAHAAADSVLFMWTTAPWLYENPGPRDVIEAWGFKAKTGRVWDKVDHNVGHYVSVRHEHLIIATRGSCLPDRVTPMLDSVVTERRRGYSEKPESFRKDIERMYDGPYLELFGREPVEGWSVFGNDSALWGQEVTR